MTGVGSEVAGQGTFVLDTRYEVRRQLAEQLRGPLRIIDIAEDPLSGAGKEPGPALADLAAGTSAGRTTRHADDLLFCRMRGIGWEDGWVRLCFTRSNMHLRSNPFANDHASST